MLHFIKSFFLKKYLSKHTVTRNVQISSIVSAKSIAFLCEITEDESSYKEVIKLFTQLQKSNRHLWLIGYIDKKEIPFFCIQQLTVDFISKKDFSWFGKPIKVQICDFINSNFDLLIDFTQRPLLPIQSILSLSQAHFITGSNDANKDLYDLHIKSSYPFTPKELLENINIYTKKLTGEI